MVNNWPRRLSAAFVIIELVIITGQLILGNPTSFDLSLSILDLAVSLICYSIVYDLTKK